MPNKADDVLCLFDESDPFCQSCDSLESCRLEMKRRKENGDLQTDDDLPVSDPT